MSDDRSIAESKDRGESPARRAHRLPPSVPGIVLLFGASRFWYFRSGVEFDATSLGIVLQFLDPELLSERLAESLWNLHSQPPLFNLFLGLVLKVAPISSSAVFAAIFGALGLLNLLAMDSIMRGMGVHPAARWGVIVLSAFNPSFVLVENWLFYTHPLGCMVTFAAWAWMKYAKGRRLAPLVFLFVLLFSICMTRSLFHLAWYAVLSAVVVVLSPGARRRAACVAALPGLVIVLWYLKNLVLFGSFGASTWMGMSLAKNTTFRLSEEERRAHVEHGELSPLAMVIPQSKFSSYREYLAKEKTGIPALDQLYKSSGGMNFNNIAIIRICEIYADDAKWVMGHYPLRALESQRDSWENFFQTTAGYFGLDPMRFKVDGLDRFYRKAVYLQQDRPRKLNSRPGTFFQFYLPLDRRPFSWTLVTMFIVTAIWTPWRWLRMRGEGHVGGRVLLFIWLNVMYVAVVGNLLETGENNRFRFNIEPVSWIVLAAFVSWATNALRASWSRNHAAP